MRVAADPRLGHARFALVKQLVNQGVQVGAAALPGIDLNNAVRPRLAESPLSPESAFNDPDALVAHVTPASARRT